MKTKRKKSIDSSNMKREKKSYGSRSITNDMRKRRQSGMKSCAFGSTPVREKVFNTKFRGDIGIKCCKAIQAQTQSLMRFSRHGNSQSHYHSDNFHHHIIKNQPRRWLSVETKTKIAANYKKVGESFDIKYSIILVALLPLH